MYSYVSLSGDMINAIIEVTIGNTTVTARMEYNSELGYPLMYISNIEDIQTINNDIS